MNRIDVIAILTIVAWSFGFAWFVYDVKADTFLDLHHKEIAKDVHEGFPAAEPMEIYSCVATERFRICHSKFMNTRIKQASNEMTFPQSKSGRQ